ncbi:hypothetical protein BDQ17DRAFT_1209973, partial [Cyathus striatus]
FVQQLIFRCNTTALFGEHFPQEIFEDFIIYDDNVHYLLAQIPFLSRKGKHAQNRIVAALDTYVSQVWSDDSGGHLKGASEVISNVSRELMLSGMTHDEVHHILLAFMWGMSSNHIRTAFWVLAHILTDPRASVGIRNQVREALDGRVTDISTFISTDEEYIDGPCFSACKGKHLAMHTIRMFIILCFYMFDMEV